jgi:hypothetical protein
VQRRDSMSVPDYHLRNPPVRRIISCSAFLGPGTLFPLFRRLGRGPAVRPLCGYDLRATPGRCPECGVAPAAAVVETEEAPGFPEPFAPAVRLPTRPLARLRIG